MNDGLVDRLRTLDVSIILGESLERREPGSTTRQKTGSLAGTPASTGAR